jgi:hypothetical protein
MGPVRKPNHPGLLLAAAVAASAEEAAVAATASTSTDSRASASEIEEEENAADADDASASTRRKGSVTPNAAARAVAVLVAADAAPAAVGTKADDRCDADDGGIRKARQHEAAVSSTRAEATGARKVLIVTVLSQSFNLAKRSDDWKMEPPNSGRAADCRAKVALVDSSSLFLDAW